jgi:hypothetical protein
MSPDEKNNYKIHGMLMIYLKLKIHLIEFIFHFACMVGYP